MINEKITIESKLGALKQLKDKGVDVIELYILQEIVWDCEDNEGHEYTKEDMDKMLHYTYNLWYKTEDRVDPCELAFQVVQNWQRILKNPRDNETRNYLVSQAIW